MNYYAQAIDQLEKIEGEVQLRAIVVEFAKKHPKAFIDAAKSVTTDWKVEARRLYESGQIVQSIKYCRELTGMGLMEAKDAVEAL